MSAYDAGLRARLVAVGVDLVAREGVQALSLREIARQAGVSHGAPRRYFPTHAALLSAIARQGFAALAAEAAAAVAAVADGGGATDGRTVADGGGATDGAAPANGRAVGPRARILALGRVYLGFAAANRGMFELMFRHDLLENGGPGQAPGLRETSLPLFGVLVDLVAEVRPRSDGAPTPEVVAGALWANLHGIAQLWAWGSLQLASGVDDAEPLLRAALGAHLGPERP
ncbi:TetR/AcrR family transcriptional regulator [Streptomyces sp. JV176]|uniref:TetR/AcrR family transcriptional regulator n=1 Tax=Streptomyces sp. JV176 TaxID=858630 RepID=UPI002E77A3B8|nr:TetR/AcrR family transcriptional regulator [Streptomyces sp. JV176]MEE1803131.1 TetR/AcrR family transcriptional regulator [Streptomyces sp. JV176]